MRPEIQAIGSQGAPSRWKVGQPRKAPEGKAGFYLVLTYLLFEFGRPQEIVPGLKLVPLGLGLSLLILLSVFLSGKLNFSRPQTKLWLVLLGVMAIHVPIAVNNFWALMTFKDMFLLFGVYLGITIYVDTVERMMTLMKSWLATHAFLAVMGVAKGGVGIGGWMGDENDFCMAMVMVAPFAYFLIFANEGISMKARYGAFLGVFILAAMASLSRGGFIGLASVGTYCWYRSPKKLNALILVFVAIVFMAALAPEKYWDEIGSSVSDETMQKGTGAERLYTWGIGMEMFAANPIIGIGQSNFPWTFELYQGDRTFLGKSIAGRQAHSAWVTLVTELGLVGVVLVGMMFFQCYKDLRLVRIGLTPGGVTFQRGRVMRSGEDIRVYLARAMEGSLIGFIVCGVFISILWYPSFWIMMAFVVALRNMSEADVRQVASRTLPPWNTFQAPSRHIVGRPVNPIRNA